MSDAKHTPGEWRGREVQMSEAKEYAGRVSSIHEKPWYRHEILSEDGYVIAASVHGPNARRIVALWNALEGVSTEELEKIASINSEWDRLKTLMLVVDMAMPINPALAAAAPLAGTETR